MPWPRSLIGIYSKFQPHLGTDMNCTAAYLASPYNPKWLRIPCDISVTSAVIICEANSTSNWTGLIKKTFRKRSDFDCPQTWFKSDLLCLSLVQMNTSGWYVPNVIGTRDFAVCNDGKDTGLANRRILSLSFLHQWSGNSNRRWIISKAGGSNCSLSPSDMDGSMGGYSVVLRGPCENLIAKADYVLCDVPVQTVEFDICLPGHFRCQSGTCILNTYQCDGVNHCEDSSDETDCNNVCWVSDTKADDVNCFTNCSRPFCRCSEHYYQCKGGGCIPWSSVCDCKGNCADGSDEESCPDNTCTIPLYRSHSEYQLGLFHCDTEQSISVALVNDKMPDCLKNLQDEEFYVNISMGHQQKENTRCERSGDIPCQDGLPRCFPRDQLCIFERHDPGGINWCRNGEHLRNCFDFECPGHFKCWYSFCIPFHMACDGRYDCPDGEDEWDCEEPCQGLLKCAADGFCVHPNNIGDGKVQCKLSGDDEVVYQHFHCPSYCNCKGLSATCAERALLGPKLWEWPLNSLNYSKTEFQLNSNSIMNLPKSLLALDISYN